MKLKLAIILIIFLAFYGHSFGQRGTMTNSTGSVSHSGGAGTSSGTPISITGSGKIMGVKVYNSSSSGTHGSITVKIDGITYASANISVGNYYLQGSAWDGISTTNPTHFKGIEFQSSFDIDLTAFSCTSCQTTVEVMYSLD